MKLLKGKTAIITGASRGIGKGIAKVFALNGANVAFTFSKSVELAKEFEKELNSLGVKAIAYQSDAANYSDSIKLIEKINTDFDNIDILVNNAGITKDNLLMRMQEEDFNQVIKVNLNSVFNMTKAVQKIMLKQRSGSIINMSSVVGVKGNAGQSNYAASKAGIIGFSKSIALELGSRNIRCNVIAPGFIETEMTKKLDEKIIDNWRNSIPLKRGGTPVDVANACVWLASDMSSYVTGQVLNIDGGLLT
ncbi:MAG: 3-oxoacyl-[acyl-carrier-protein] reductase [Flavobacteriaceae bacterium]|jgi:3-oxoacyl-[acyl-carrier protein] reductase|nr:3-oxoacyl-[acyl-carrier-protein] reductase [Flavobacteriaceae bacterium]MBT4112590.1 3-oxoacyl-[acyl-carrier-protein] reductase [Flavobacteriaceae bacterium]MBT4614444.1 3-oxoacyl-[acyl-carrier-protein] reductase [Flavobacteriaceae bacterium]MBT5246897.1 3-oxoacyl-[acyl-carrier-protein] reductase [Flavobacteriaceae bacterium]MBT5771750.1 3-oxoacyl-[acyl-carrier-protein] reductase [Flavobacteriaceae bacterium]|tara:strand:+ start:14 stop:760 length:747 start_codon:yes stop_codon:yes gene_type:complete